ncbi:TPA: hypothetical protein UM674_000213 [Stenotrophomonas maltophilia]|nr:hypothetical protein [Stenotrophomonas maltophilia]
MSAMNDHLLSATGSFGLETACSMLKKASREYRRCTTSETEDDMRDAAINCAITLWHMNDWAWNGIANSSKDKPEIKSLLGVTGRRIAKDDLVKWAVASCPELNVCQSICNGSKHVVCTGITEARMIADESCESDDDAKVLSRLEIVDTEGVRDAKKVLFTALCFWNHHATNEGVLR